LFSPPSRRYRLPTFRILLFSLFGLSLCCWSVFFFQAEDGIRDDLVTGVQTCALPIYRRQGIPGWCWVLFVGVLGVIAISGMGRRSEERRVGKEWRSRWAAGD